MKLTSAEGERCVALDNLLGESDEIEKSDCVTISYRPVNQICK
jgi:hypothetical protein